VSGAHGGRRQYLGFNGAEATKLLAKNNWEPEKCETGGGLEGSDGGHETGRKE